MLCDYLVIGVNSDESVSKLKGPERPYWPLFIRLEHVNDFGQGIPFNGEVVHLLKAIRPDILIRGEDQSDEGIQYAKDFHRIVRIPGYSTSALAS